MRIVTSLFQIGIGIFCIYRAVVHAPLLPTDVWLGIAAGWIALATTTLGVK